MQVPDPEVRQPRSPFPVPRSSFFLLLSLLIAIHHCVTCLAPITHLSRVCALVGTIPTHHPHWTTFIGAGGRGLAARGTSLPPTLHPATHISHTSVPPRRTWRRPGRTAWSPRQRQGMTTIGDHRPHAHRRGCTYHACCTKMGPMRTENGSHPDRLRFRTLVMVHRWTVKRTRICDAFPPRRVPDDVACATSSHLRSMGGTCSLIESRPPSKLTRQVGETGQISDFCFTSPAEPRPS